MESINRHVNWCKDFTEALLSHEIDESVSPIILSRSFAFLLLIDIVSFNSLPAISDSHFNDVFPYSWVVLFPLLHVISNHLTISPLFTIIHLIIINPIVI